MHRTGKRALWLIGIAMMYIVAQSVWWAFLLLQRDAEVQRLERELAAVRHPAGAHAVGKDHLLMVVGEAGVFLILLAVVLGLAFRAVRRELRATTLQRNFLLAVTHELRTPIAAIKLQLQTLSRPGLPAGTSDELRRSSIQEVERLTLLTDRVLLAASAGDGTVPLELEELDVVRTVREVAERARQQGARDHTLQLAAPEQLMVMCDPQALRSIAENLVENATKYAPKESRINVVVEQVEHGWRLSVADEGPGIPADQRARIFDRFYRIGREETRQHPGTGLGLYIVERLVRRGAATFPCRPA